MLQRTKQMVSSFDLFPVPITLKKSEDSDNKSFPTAIFSLIIIGASIYYMVINVLSVVNYDKITSST